MITPAFDLSQDPDFLILSARVPYTRTSEFDLYIDGTDLKFYAKPYFLRLTLPGKIVEDGREKATFDVDKGVFILRVPKETAGEHFEGLQMLTSLLAPKGSRSAKPLVEDIGMEACGGSAEEDEDEEDFDWQVDQEVYTESSEEELGSQQKYGFGNQRSGVFARLQEELSDVIDLKNPEGTTAAERKEARLIAETSIFCHDHYLLDLYEDEVIRGLLKYRPWWAVLGPSPDREGESAVCFTDDEKEQLRKFPNRSYLLDKAARHHVWLSLVDILLAYAYDVRFTEGEHTVESPWTIRKLSGTLCWLETYGSLREVLMSFGRRVLCYPLCRHFDLVTAAIQDTAQILASGKACVLKCLLNIHQVFRENDPAYILNDLYITDYCIWIQRIKSRKVTALAGPLQKVSLRKKDLQLELDVLEEAAAIVVEEEEEDQEAEESRHRAPGSVVETHSDSSSDSSSSSSSSDSSSSSSSSGGSSEGGEELESEEQGCAPSSGGGAVGRGGGGGEGGESAKASPLRLWPPSSQAPSPTPTPPPNAPALSAPDGCRRLIEELGEQVAAELQIAEQRAEAEPHSAAAPEHS